MLEPGSSSLELRNGESARIGEVPGREQDRFRQAIVESVGESSRLAALIGFSGGGGSVSLLAVVAEGGTGALSLSSTEVSKSYPTLTRDCPPAHLFERALAERWGIVPEGHPWLKPVRFLAGGERAPGTQDFFAVQGEEVHEVAVGPVHAGVIEPGHFRFQCHGEEVLHLEIALGYQHRGVEDKMVGGPTKRSIHYAETVAGDTTIGHATAYCEALESLSGCLVPARAQALRGIALELERLANHIGDLGALAGDIGYLPTAAFCGRLRGEFLGMTALACGSRFGRSWMRPGGVAFDLDSAQVTKLDGWLEHALTDARQAVGLLWDSPTVQARFEETGVVTRQVALDLGLVGPAARASGLERDARQDFPAGIWRFNQIPVSLYHTGDVFARAFVRWQEIQRSADYVRAQLKSLPGGEVRSALGTLSPDRIVVTVVEGWRGEIVHVAITGPDRRFAHYAIIDPSFHNWAGLAAAMRRQEISDFPLCNKSFNLSYCGHDL